MPPPFTTVELTLKQIRLDALQPVEKKSMTYFFPNYLGKGFSKSDIQQGLLKVAQDEGFDIVQDNTLPRRYAGDLTLPRTGYHSVCRNETGDDGGTLVNELRAYSKMEESGLFVVIDSTCGDADALQARELLKGGQAVICLPKDTPVFPTPYAELAGVDRRQHRGLLVAVLPVSLTRQRIEKVIDLRLPKTQEWFTQQVTRLHDPTTKKPCFPLAGPLTEFVVLLPALLSQSLGDNRQVTQIAGIWLRNLGANAVIFPAARTDAMTKIVDGQLVDWVGWNLVDYREAGPPLIGGALDVSPTWEKSPLYGGNMPLTDGGSMALVYDRTRITQTAEGREAGSLRVEGIQKQREGLYQFAIWTHFAGRLRIAFPTVEVGRLNQFVFTVSRTENGLDLERLGRATTHLLGALFGAAPARQSLQGIGQQFQQKGQTDLAQALVMYLQLCEALTEQAKPE